jgi:hypothetical protein
MSKIETAEEKKRALSSNTPLQHKKDCICILFTFLLFLVWCGELNPSSSTIPFPSKNGPIHFRKKRQKEYTKGGMRSLYSCAVFLVVLSTVSLLLAFFYHVDHPRHYEKASVYCNMRARFRRLFLYYSMINNRLYSPSFSLLPLTFFPTNKTTKR